MNPIAAGASAGREGNAPNRYDLQDDDVTITYYPGGNGPVLPVGRSCLSYQDGAVTEELATAQVSRHALPGVGTAVSFALPGRQEAEGGSDITVVLFLPDVDLTVDPAGRFQTIAIRAHSSYGGQPTRYQVEHLDGQAASVLIALDEPINPAPSPASSPA